MRYKDSAEKSHMAEIIERCLDTGKPETGIVGFKSPVTTPDGPGIVETWVRVGCAIVSNGACVVEIKKLGSK